MFLGAMIMGPLGGWSDQEARRPVGAARSSRASRCWSTTSRPASPRPSCAIGSMFVLGPILRAVMTGLGNGVEWLVAPPPAAADRGLHRAGQGAVPQQRDQPRRPHPARARPGQAAGHSALFLLEANPGPGAGMLLAFMVFGRGRRQGHGARCLHHPVPRRHPRGLLPLRPRQAESDARPDRGRRDRHVDERDLQLRAGRSRLRRARSSRSDSLAGQGQLRGRHAVLVHRRWWSPSWWPVLLLQDGQVRGRRRPGGRDREHGGS